MYPQPRPGHAWHAARPAAAGCRSWKRDIRRQRPIRPARAAANVSWSAKRLPAGCHFEFGAPVLGPRAFILPLGNGALLAVADGFHARLGDALLREILLRRGGAALAEREIVLVRAALVGM